MISDTTLLRVSLVCVIAGLGIAYTASILDQAPLLQPGEITADHVGESVRIAGNTGTTVHRSGKHLFFTVTHSNTTLPAVWFNAEQRIPANTAVVAKGRIRFAQGELELVVDTVTLKK